MGSLYTPNHRQVCWSITNEAGQAVPVIDATKEDRSREAEAYRKLIPLIHEPGYSPKEEALSPHPILTDRSFILRMELFNDALVKALVNIVDRWWMDTDANFPTRMPLEAPVEAALQVGLYSCVSLNEELLLTPNAVARPAKSQRNLPRIQGPAWKLAT